MSDLKLRLDKFLSKNGGRVDVQQLTPDASTREYFRIKWNGESAIACVYPESFIAVEQSYLDVSRLFASNGLPVAEIYTFDEDLGIIVQEDLGDTILRDVLLKSENAVREDLIDESIRLIAKIQAATQRAYETNSIASRLKFDVEKLLWELNFFREHYFVTLRKSPLTPAENEALDIEFFELSSELESRASVLCHRDFHAANLMIDKHGNLRIIDHQDARVGSPTYDLVSLLLDRVPEPPPAEWLHAKRSLLLNERIDLGLEAIDEHEFTHEFRLQTVQRCLKAVGTFSYQSVNRGKTYFLPYIKPMFRIVSRALANLNGFQALNDIVERQIDSVEG
jgi:aminoglycoside/choline kinase family phosphotransferase